MKAVIEAELADRLARRTDAWCRIPSPTGFESDLADRVAAEALAAGLVATRHRHCLVLRRPNQKGPVDLALVGHLDTVRPATDQPEGIFEGRVWGCGASDMKGALAVMFDRLCEPSRHSLLGLFYDREEGPFADNGLAWLRAEGLLPEARAAVVMEPTGNAIEAGCMGNLHAELVLHGRRAHSARPWQGENALHAAHPVLAALAAMAYPERRVGGLPFREVLSATTATTRNGRNVVPDTLTLNLNLRFSPDRSLAEAEAGLREWIEGLRLRVPWDLDITDRAPGGRVCMDAPLIGPWRLRHGLPVRPKQAWTDVAQLTEAGIPAVNFGPGDPAEAHQARESVRLADLVRAWQLLDDLAEGP